MTSFLEKVAEAGLPPPPFDPLVTRFYDVPYEGSRSVKLALWYINELSVAQKDIVEKLIEKMGQAHPLYKNYYWFSEALGESLIAVYVRDALELNTWMLTPPAQGRPKDFQIWQRELRQQDRPPIRPRFSPYMGYQFGRKYRIFVNQTKESLDLMSEESKEQIAKIVFIGGSVLTVFVFFLAAGAFLPPLQAKL